MRTALRGSDLPRRGSSRAGMPMTPDIRDLDNLLEALRTRHAVFYYTAIVLSALGVFGVACLLGLLRHGIALAVSR